MSDPALDSAQQFDDPVAAERVLADRKTIRVPLSGVVSVKPGMRALIARYPLVQSNAGTTRA